MRQPETIFVIPTCRLRDVPQTIEEYDKNFWANGHATKIIVFDDSSVSNHEKYYPLLEQTKTFNDIFYVGPREKEQFISFLNEFRPVITNKNWRMDCGVAGYDNRLGLPPFFPTRLRFEDYIYRLWIQQEGIVAAHVDAVQNHTRNNYMRNPLASEIFNEEICNLLKRRIKDSVYHLDDMGIKFDYYGEVTLQESEEILEKISTIHTHPNPERQYSLQLFSENLSRVFYGFEADFFQQNVSRIVDDVISQFHASLEIWPTLVEICYLQKDKKNLPQILVKNKKLKA